MQHFFSGSQEFHTQLTALYDLVNPTAAAMWNLRWQVRGYLEERKGADKRELHGRFIVGSGIGSANLRRHCVERTWEEQLGEMALLAMFGAVGLYEGWISALDVGTNNQRQRLQFPSRGVVGRTSLGVRDTVSTLRLTLSNSLEVTYGANLRSSRRFMPARLDDMLVAYRCFKEVRNVCAHAGRMPNHFAVTAYMNAKPRVGGLGKDGRDLQLPVVSAGQAVKLSLLNVQALCALLLNMVTTLDAELAVTQAAERSLLNRWRSRHSFRMLPADTNRRNARLRIMNRQAGLPSVTDTDALYGLLKDARLVI